VILVLGGSGQLGTAFSKILPHARFPSRQELDLAQLGGHEQRLDAWAPTAIINCAAYTDVDKAEQDEDSAFAINAVAVGHLGRFCDDRGIPFVTFSTDYVFDGEADLPYVESDTTNPINAYGRSKAEGERLALVFPGSLVIRTSWLISATHPNFVATIVRLVASGPVEVVDDQHGCPTAVDDLAAAAMQALAAGMTGVLHVTSAPPTTWYGLAVAVTEAVGLDEGRILPCSTDHYPRPAPRPRWSVLGSERMGLEPLPGWTESLPELARALQESPPARR
jgi:dTDP-4-dehydrorhamnose reductase